MQKNIIRILLLILMFIGQVAWAQKNNNSQLAFKYYRDKEFDRAAILYQELYETSGSRTYLRSLIKCYNELKWFDKAEKTLQKEIKKHKHDVYLKVMLGSVYKNAGKPEKAEKLYLKLIQKSDKKRHTIVNLANAFISSREYAYAEKAYLSKHNPNDNVFNFTFEIANVHYYSRNYEKMMDAYLDALKEGDKYLRSIQNRLQATVYNQGDGSLNDILKQKLISRIQKNGNNSTYNELLIWLYLQEKNFGKAFIQTRALDKRNKEDGERLIALGKMSAENLDYKNAERCFKYVMDLGEGKAYFIAAQIGYIEALQAIILKNLNSNQEQVQNLVTQYENFLSRKTTAKQRAEVSISFAHLLTFFQHQQERGIGILEEVISKPNLPTPLLSKAKIEYADQLLYSGKIWDATLFYSQVIKANPNNEIGNEAQLKKAKLAFYSGDFLWAKGQLDVLKASTSKLISNDAFYISSLISDNLEVDSLTQALEQYAKADLFIFQNKKDSALLTLQALEENFPEDAIIDDVIFKKAELLTQNNKLDSAISIYEDFLNRFQTSILADNALMNLANIYWNQGKKEKATELYTQVLTDFSDSFLCTEARRKIVEYRDSDD